MVLKTFLKTSAATALGRLTGCVENELGLRHFLEERKHEFIVTESKDGPDNELDKHLPDTHIVCLVPAATTKRSYCCISNAF